MLGGVLFIFKMVFGESDGRCVRASGPFSGGRSIPLLLLNPPSDAYFNATSVFTGSVNVAHFFPSRALHLDLTFWALPILLTI